MTDEYWDTLDTSVKKDLIVLALVSTFEKYSIKDINSVLADLRRK